MGEMRKAYKILVENLKGRDHSEDLSIDIRWILEKQGGKMWIGFGGLRSDQWQPLVNTAMKLQVP
jgi:hypothetical protein